MPTPTVFTYCSGLYLAGGKDREQLIATTNAENLVLFLRRLSQLKSMATQNIPSDTRSLMRTKVLLFFNFEGRCWRRPVLSGLPNFSSCVVKNLLRAFQHLSRAPRSTDCIMLAMSCRSLGITFETGITSDITATRAQKCPEVDGEILLNVPGRNVAWL